MRIATEEAFVTPAIWEGWQRVLAGQPEPGFVKMGASVFGDSPAARDIKARLLDLDDGRIATMAGHGVDFQIISMTSPGVQAFGPDEGHALACESNDILAEAVARHPDKFAGLGTVAVNAAERAAVELQRCRDRLGLRGLIVNSHSSGLYLDDPSCAPLLEAAADLDMPLYLHPREPSPQMVDPFLDYGLYFAGWGFAVECGTHAMRLIMSGVFDRFPKLRIILGHMGEGIPFWLPRIDNRYLLQVKTGAVKKLERLPSEYFLDNFIVTTSGHNSYPALHVMIAELGVARIMFAGDYPYESVPESIAWLDKAPVSAEDLEKIYSGNARRIFKLT